MVNLILYSVLLFSYAILQLRNSSFLIAVSIFFWKNASQFLSKLFSNNCAKVIWEKNFLLCILTGTQAEVYATWEEIKITVLETDKTTIYKGFYSINEALQQ